MAENKLKWAKPKLIVLSRGNTDGVHVLTNCKVIYILDFPTGPESVVGGCSCLLLPPGASGELIDDGQGDRKSCFHGCQQAMSS